MEDIKNEVHLLSDSLKNNSIRETANTIINKHQLDKHTYNNEEDVFEKVGELDIINEDIWKDNIHNNQKLVLTEEILFDIYRVLYSSVTKDKTKKY